jgi:hypothetical protein
MQITTVTVRHGELRSTGYPSFSNRRYELELTAQLSAGETGSIVKAKLLEICKREVARMFDGKEPTEEEMHQPLPF